MKILVCIYVRCETQMPSFRPIGADTLKVLLNKTVICNNLYLKFPFAAIIKYKFAMNHLLHYYLDFGDMEFIQLKNNKSPFSEILHF